MVVERVAGTPIYVLVIHKNNYAICQTCTHTKKPASPDHE